MKEFTTYALVAAGGMLGAMSRYFVSSLLRNSNFPHSTLLVNIIGCFFMGIIVELYSIKTNFSEELKNTVIHRLFRSFYNVFNL